MIETDANDIALVEQEMQKRRAELGVRVRNVIIGVVFFNQVLLIALWFFFQEYGQLAAAVGANSVPLAGCILYLLFERFQYDQLGRWFFLGGIIIVAFIVPFVIENIILASGSVLIAVVIVGYLIMDTQSGHINAVICAATFLAMLLIVRDWDVTEHFTTMLNADFEALLSGGIGFIVLMTDFTLIWMIITGQENMFRESRLAQMEVSRQVELVEQQRGKLEVANQEIASRSETEQAQNQNLQQLIVQIQDAAMVLNAATQEIQATITEQVATTAQQDAAVVQTTATLEQIRATVAQTAKRAEAVAEASNQSVEVASAGLMVVDDSIKGMQRIREQVEDIARTILTLSERTQQIGEIIDAVNALADQSKLLALNASIEAARAGEEGRGFAVVAMEVRQLAEQSREATSRVQDILYEIQQATNTAVMVTEEGSKGADTGIQLVGRVGNVIRDLASTIGTASNATQQIVASTQQQATGMDQLATAMVQIRQASAQSTASMKQTEASVQELSRMANQLDTTASQHTT